MQSDSSRYILSISIDSEYTSESIQRLARKCEEEAEEALRSSLSKKMEEATEVTFFCEYDSSIGNENLSLIFNSSPLYAIICQMKSESMSIESIVSSDAWRGLLDSSPTFTGDLITIHEQLLQSTESSVLSSSSPNPEAAQSFFLIEDSLEFTEPPDKKNPLRKRPGNAPPSYEALVRDINSRQESETDDKESFCPGRRAIVFSFSSFNRYGFATALHHVSLALAYARESNRTLVIRDPDQWIYTDSKCEHGFHCYFQPISPCTEEAVSALVEGEQRWSRNSLHESNEQNRVVYYTSAGATYGVVSKSGASYRNLWWRAHLMRYLLQVNDGQREAVIDFRRRHNWPSAADDTERTLGIHVRHGDKKVEVSRLHTWQEYLVKAESMLSEFNGAINWLVFITSDDPGVIEAASSEETAQRLSRAAGGGRVRVIHREEKRLNAAVHAALTKGEESGLEQGQIALQNILLLSSCDELLGTFSSSFFKLAYELRFAYRGRSHAKSLDLSKWQA